MPGRFKFLNLDPICSTVVISDAASKKSLIDLDIETKIQFRNEEGAIFHEYIYSSDRHIQNCGGYEVDLIRTTIHDLDVDVPFLAEIERWMSETGREFL